MSNLFEIKKYTFNQKSLSDISNNHYAKGLWPLVYILSNEEIREAYVGETTDTISRMSTHLKNNSKSKLTAVHLISSDKFNKSATLDIESNLIKYIAGDGKYKLLNGNLGLANHTYYQKGEVYWDMFKTIWKELKSAGITRSDLDTINNSDLFKYSPYKTLTSDQKNSLIEIIKNLLDDKVKTIIIEGGAGTGKTILATFLFKLLNSEIEDVDLKDFGEDEMDFLKIVIELRKKYIKPKMALIIPMAGFRDTIKKVFTNIKGLKRTMVIGPAEIASEKFDLLFVDESHRLRQRKNLGNYFKRFDEINKILFAESTNKNELDWVIKQSSKSILFYDENQSIKPSDVEKNNFDILKQKNTTSILKLQSQLRVKGGVDYVTYIKKLLNCQFRKEDNIFKSKDYEFKLFESFEDMFNQIKIKNTEHGLSRLIAGYSWKWQSKNSDNHDIEIDGVKLNWNSVSKDWVNSSNSINEVGCIHTSQGYDLNYTGVVFGNEISYDKETNQIIINRNDYFDTAGRQGIEDPEELKNFIQNIYETILLRGIKGTYIFACDKNLREYLKKHVLTQKKSLPKILSPITYETVNLAVFESVGCGDLMFADSTVQDIIPVRKDYISPGTKYFVLKVSGNSMNLAGINDGDYVLCRKEYQPNVGDNVVALIGDDATIKEYTVKGKSIILKPKSTNKNYKPIEFKVGDDLKIQGVVERVLNNNQ